MRDERIIEEMAKLDRVEIIMCNKKRVPSETGLMKCMKVFDRGGWFSYEPIHNYLNDHNACQRVIDLFNGYELSKYACRLIDIFTDQIEEQEHLAASGLRCAIKATPRQKCEAILKVKGLWI